MNGLFSVRRAAMAAPDVRPRLVAQGLYADIRCGAAFADFLRKEHDGYGSAIRAANIKVE